MWKRLVILAAFAIGHAHQITGASLMGGESYEEATGSNETDPIDDAPELVDEEGDWWGVVEQHAEGALLAINTKRNDADMSVLSNMTVQHAYHLMIGSREGFRICVSAKEDGETTYAEIDTESGETKETFESIFNIMPLDILGSAMASTFEGRNNNGLLSQYPCDNTTEGLIQVGLGEKVGLRAMGHIDSLEPFDTIDTYQKRFNFVSTPASFNFYDEYPQCEVPVQDQGTCGSCYAFAATVMLDGRACKAAIDAGGSYDLRRGYGSSSEQDILSCGTDNPQGDCDRQYMSANGCNGGNANGVIGFVREHGLVKGEWFPYVSGGTGAGADHFAQNDGVVPTCSHKTCEADEATKDISHLKKCTAGHVSCIKNAIMKGPVYASVKAGSYFSSTPRRGDIILDRPQDRVGGANHAVSLHGWDREGDVDYWLAQNSWGESWGEQGRFRIDFRALYISNNVQWSDPMGDADDYYMGDCIKLEEDTDALTCTLTNECDGVVKTQVAYKNNYSGCTGSTLRRTYTFSPGQVRTMSSASVCVISWESDHECTNDVPDDARCDNYYGVGFMCALDTSESFPLEEVCCACGGGTRPGEPTSAPMSKPSAAPTGSAAPTVTRCAEDWCKPGTATCGTNVDITQPVAKLEGGPGDTLTLNVADGTPCAPECQGATCPGYPGSSAFPFCRYRTPSEYPNFCALLCKPGRWSCPDTMRCEMQNFYGLCVYGNATEYLSVS